MALTESSLTTVSIFLKVGSGSMLTTIISSERQRDNGHITNFILAIWIIYNTIPLLVQTHTYRVDILNKKILVNTCCRVVVRLLVCSPVDEFPQRGDSIGTNQSVATKSPAVHHSDVQRRVKQLILWQILTYKVQN